MDEKRVDVFAHRAGFYKEGETGPGAENTFERAKHSLRFVDGLEIDVDFTADGVAVVTHDKLFRKGEDGKKYKLYFDEFKEKYPKHATLESWLDWFSQEGMEGKKLYLDLKGTEQDSFQLLEAVQSKGLADRVFIGTKDARTLTKLLLARKALDVDSKIFLQIPDPASAEKAVAYARTILSKLGVDEKRSDLQGLKPDGLHFFWPDNFLKDVIAEFVKHGEFVPMTDRSVKVPWYRRWPNFPVFYNMMQARIRDFVSRSQEEGYEVIMGSTGSPASMQRWIERGVVGVMPNVPDRMPEALKREPLPVDAIPEPNSQFTNELRMRESQSKFNAPEIDTEAEQQYYDWVGSLPELEKSSSPLETARGMFGGIPIPGDRLRQNLRRWWRGRKRS